MNDKEKIKKAAMFIDSFLVRTNTNLKKYAASKDLPDNEVIIEILDIIRFKDEPEDTIIDQKLEEIKKILTS